MLESPSTPMRSSVAGVLFITERSANLSFDLDWHFCWRFASFQKTGEARKAEKQSARGFRVADDATFPVTRAAVALVRRLRGRHFPVTRADVALVRRLRGRYLPGHQGCRGPGATSPRTLLSRSPGLTWTWCNASTRRPCAIIINDIWQVHPVGRYSATTTC